MENSTARNITSHLTKTMMEQFLQPNITVAAPNMNMSIKALEFFLSEKYWRHIFFAIAVIGVIGNVLSLAVLSRKTFLGSFPVFLRTLAVLDVLILLLYPCFVYRELLDTIMSYEICASFVSCWQVLKLQSNWCVVFVTGERLIAVLFPYRAKTICTKKTAALVLIMTLVMSLMFTTPVFFMVDIIYNSCWFLYNAWIIDYLDVASYISFVVPLLLVIVMNIGITVRVRLAAKQRNMMSATSDNVTENDKTSQLAAVLFLISTSFIIFTIPHFLRFSVFKSWFSLADHMLTHPQAMIKKAINVSAYLGTMCKHSANFIFYVARSQKFRDELCLMVCCKRLTENKQK